MADLYYLTYCWDCDNCTPNSNCLGKVFTDEQKKSLLGTVKPKKPIKAGETIFRIENCFSSLYIIKTGSVMSRTITENGDEFIRGFYFPGDILGVDSISCETYRNDAVAIEQTMVCEMPYNKLEQLCFAFPSLHKDIMAKFSEEIIASETRLMSQNSLKNANEKVLSFLSYLSRKTGVNQLDGSLKINLPMTKYSIAAYLGIRPESLSRALEKLKKQGLIENQTHEIVIMKPEELLISNFS